MSKRKGSVYERELLSLFHGIGFSGVRVAGSGCSSFPSPDLVVGSLGKSFSVEVKATKNDFVYVNNEQIQQLLEFSANFGSTPLIGVKFIGKGWRFFSPLKNIDNKNTVFRIADSSYELNDVIRK